MKSIILLLTIASFFSPLKEKHTDQQQMKIDLSAYDKVNIYNSSGAVKVNPIQGSGNQAVVNATRKLSATSKKKLNRAIKEIYIDTMVVDGELYFYIVSPNRYLKSGGGDYLHYQSKDQFNNYNEIKESGINYEFELDILLPQNTKAVVSTHRGDIELNGIQGDLSALNHHGNVYLNNVQNLQYAHSHHGVIDVSFDRQSDHDIKLDTHHGDITIKFPNTPSAELDLYSYHGSFYTDFDWKPGKMIVENNRKNKKTKYKVGSKTRVLMGSASKKIQFNSHHGNMYILKS